jgi:ATP synthase protein I
LIFLGNLYFDNRNPDRESFMTDDLKTLQDRIRQARAEGVGEDQISPGEDAAPNDSEGTNKGLRAVADLVGTPVICGAIGIGLDNWLDTSPYGFIILAFLGLLAGFWGLYKMSAGAGSEVGFKRLQNKKKEGKKAQLSEDTTKQ